MPTPLRRALLVLVWAISLALLAKGVGQLLWRPGTGYDMRLQWMSAQYFLRGANPFDASFYANDLARGIRHETMPVFFPDIGWPEMVAYPPTSTLTQILVYGWPTLSITRAVYVLLSTAGFAVVGVWAARRICGPRLTRWLVAGLALANLGYSQTIVNGNYGIIVMAALVLALHLRQRHTLLAGVCLGAALVKPTMAAPFFLFFLMEGRVAVIVASLAYLAASTVLAMALAHADPLTLLQQTIEGSSRFSTGGYAIWQPLKAMGFSQGQALALNALVFLVPLVWLMWRWRRRLAEYELPLLACCAVAARLFTYHNSIDNVLVSFLIIAITSRAIAAADVIAAVVAGLVAASVLVPYVLTNSVAGHVALYSIWSAAAVYSATSVGPRRLTTAPVQASSP